MGAQIDLLDEIIVDNFAGGGGASTGMELAATDVVKPERTWCPSGSYSGGHDDIKRGCFTTDKARQRAKTFPGIAEAMAEQWGGTDE